MLLFQDLSFAQVTTGPLTVQVNVPQDTETELTELAASFTTTRNNETVLLCLVIHCYKTSPTLSGTPRIAYRLDDGTRVHIGENYTHQSNWSGQGPTIPVVVATPGTHHIDVDVHIDSTVGAASMQVRTDAPVYAFVVRLS